MTDMIMLQYPITKKETGKKQIRDKWLLIATFQRCHVKSIWREWTDLVQRSAEDNVYYSPEYAMALLDTVEHDANVQFLTAWDGDRLMAFMPLVLSGYSVPGLRPAGRAWQSDYTFSCTPLLDRDEPDRAAMGLIDALAALRPGDWAIPQLNIGGPVWKAVTAALDQRKIPRLRHQSFARASISWGPRFDDHMRASVSAKRRRELTRSRRRLEELGVLEHRYCVSGDALDRAIDAFLALEAGGWKGGRGTALACREDSKAFARKAFGAATAGRPARADMLVLNGEPIAVGLIVFSGKTGFTVKGAYDEAYASFGAGLLLEVEVIRSFLEERWADRLDAATNGPHVIDKLWPDRVEVGELAFTFSSMAPQLRMSIYKSSRSIWAGAKDKIKRIARR